MPGPFIQQFVDAQSVLDAYGAPAEALKGARVLVAWYGDGCYCGSSFVLYKKAGKLFEVNGSHCSCYGLEGQWEPEETSIEALELREFRPHYDGADQCARRLAQVIRRLKRGVHGEAKKHGNR
jgi:hypothetical protein